MTAPPRPNPRFTLPPVMTPVEVAKIVRIMPSSLAVPRWDRLLTPFRTPGGHRRYRRETIADFLEGRLR